MINLLNNFQIKEFDRVIFLSFLGKFVHNPLNLGANEFKTKISNHAYVSLLKEFRPSTTPIPAKFTKS